MTFYNPWHHLRDEYPRVHVEFHDIAPAHAFWATGLDIILLDRALDLAGRRCAIAHEIAHMDVGDEDTASCWAAGRQERAADKLAARRLVHCRDLAEAMRWATDPREVAHELDVTVEVLDLRVRWMHPAERGAVEAAVRCREAVA